MPYSVGQRWISQSEPKLGLGIITEIANRRINISFPAASENRLYAIESAPLSRVQYHPGDTISNHEEKSFTVINVDDSKALVDYEVVDTDGVSQRVSEMELNCFIQFTSPLQRLSSGHLDRNSAFRLRCETLEHLHRLQQSVTCGLLGGRADLLPHQLYVADTVSKRHSPRVLLADEVGLGKTIEAGLILHSQLHNHMAQRVLIIVPESLTHQWLVEMLRRFNLHFSLFDQERLASLIEEGIEKPFETEQLVLCSLSFICENEQTTQQALAADWDLLIVDEAHHLQWSESQSSPEYDCIDQLAQKSRGVLLLTATPEQIGIESHFARLRLLDPERFHSLTEFMEQEQHYTDIAALIEELQSALKKVVSDSDAPSQTQEPSDTTATETNVTELLDATLTTKLHDVLGQKSGIDFSLPAKQGIPIIIRQLLDQHGTGRILFRNTRQSVEGFPDRVLHHYPLRVVSQFLPEENEIHTTDSKLKQDPRTDWLVNFLEELTPAKVLIICKTAELAKALDNYLRLKQGILSACFHEGLSLMERDRAAAFFADRESGASTLICSEIGSEGRNFQFANHLVLWDLPDNPDLLEQRIGRLDRIGQKQEVNIHVPYLEGREQEGLFHFYNKGLNAFTQSCSTGHSIAEHFAAPLAEYLAQCDFRSDAALDFIDDVKDFFEVTVANMAKGRDPLLELNSCNPEVAEDIISQIQLEENCQLLSAYLDRLFALQGVETEYQSDQTLIIRQSTPAPEPQLFTIPEDGKTLTYHRLKALSREDIDFITWEHPFMTEAMEQFISTELGNATLATISVNGIKPGTLFLEAIYCVNSMAPPALRLQRFLPLSPRRIVVDTNGKDLSKVLPTDKLNALCSGVKLSMRHAVISEIRPQIPNLLAKAQSIADTVLPETVANAKTALTQQLDAEINRMIALREYNPLIRESEILTLQTQLKDCLHFLDKTGLELQALRLIINT